MSPRRTGATALRVLQQFRHDHRSLALMLLVPVLLLVILRYVWDGQPDLFNSAGVTLLAIFPLTVMFIVTSVSTLRERQSGTLERLLALPLSKLDLILGYLLAFGLVAIAQALLAVLVALWWLNLVVVGPVWALVLVAILTAVLGTAMGLAFSAFARTEFQAVQFMPAFILPQFLLCGLLTPRDQMNGVLTAISDVLPMSYAVSAVQSIGSSPEVTTAAWTDIGVVVGFIALAVVAGAATLRRRTA